VIRVVLPPHLRTLAQISGEVTVAIEGEVTQRRVLDAVEERFPMLCGTMRDRSTGNRRALVRFFACSEDLSNESPGAPRADEFVSGKEPFLVVGAMAGG